MTDCIVTTHAAARYIQKVDRTSTLAEARLAIRRAFRDGHAVKTLRDGRLLWRSTRQTGRLRMVVAPACGPGLLPQVVTVLPAHDGARAC